MGRMAQINLRDVSDETYERLRLAAYLQNTTVPAVARAWLDKFPQPAADHETGEQK